MRLNRLRSLSLVVFTVLLAVLPAFHSATLAQDATPTATPTPTLRPSSTPSPTPDPDTTLTATPTATPTSATDATATATATATPSPAPDSALGAAPVWDIPPEIAANAHQWPMGNHDYANTRAAVNSSINAGNVNTLGLAWTASLKGKGGWGSAAGNPIIADDVVYFQDLEANIYAVKLDSGETIWEAQYANGIFGPAGPGIGYGKLYASTRVDLYSALDLETGASIWTYSTATQLPAGAFQPSVVNGRVYLTTQAASAGHGLINYHSYQGGASGTVIALDHETGQRQWQWMSVEEGFWGNPDINSGGGIWFPPAIDVQRGLTFWGTGNPAPFPGLVGYPNGSSRPGPNLYTNSLVALDGDGQIAWYNQVRPHDLFGLDFQISPILATVDIDGAPRDIVIGSGKDGRVFAFDRASGETLWMTPVGIHENDDLTELAPDEVVWVYPGAWGGVETPMGYADGVLYAFVVNLPSPYTWTAFDSTTGEEALNRAEGQTLLANGTGEMVALNASTGEMLWRTEFDRVGFGGVTVVNDLLFTATLDGTIFALSRADGSIVWQYKAPGGTNAWPAVAGDTLVWPIGIGSHPMVIALRLGSNNPTPTPETLRTPVRTPQGK